ncbi:MAG: lysophospholipid acyltransferase family protein [Myxococcota bacterium]|nr:lysophospholipid acyltransferase family protein [Myxococcota bacterium]
MGKRAPTREDEPIVSRVESPESELELWERETDTLSVHQIRELLERLLAAPGIEPASDILLEAVSRSVQELMRRVREPRVDRKIDRFGFDAEFYERMFPLAHWFHDHYFRVESTGAEHIPMKGRALVVANHSGTLPYDGAMVATAARLAHPNGRHLRALVEDFVYHMPFLGRFMALAGAVRACQQNARALLEADKVVLVFPEGVKGIGKPFRHRYRLQRFGRGGSIRLAMATGSPIIPCAVVGAEESMPLIGRVTWLARPLGLPYIPITPTLPLLGPLGLVPLPTKWYIDFGEPIDLSSYGPDAASDRVLVNRINEKVRKSVQDLIDRRLASRETVFGG